MNFLTDLFNKIDEQKRKKTDKESGKGDVGSVAMETKTKLLDFEKMISDAARSRGVQPRTYLTALASANPKFAESKLVQALLGEYSLGQVGMGARDKYKDRDSKIGVTTSPKPKGAKDPHFKKDKKKMKDEDVDESMHKMKKKKKMKEGIFEASPDKARAIRIDKMMRANQMTELADLLADAMHFAEITGLSFDRELQRAKDYYDEADQMETVSDCACEGEADCDCDNVEEALKFQGKYKEGDKIKAYDFKPGVPGRPDRFIIGTVIKVDAESVSQPGALGYHVKVETDMPREKESAGAGNRKGKTIFVPYEMGMDYDERISPA